MHNPIYWSIYFSEYNVKLQGCYQRTLRREQSVSKCYILDFAIDTVRNTLREIELQNDYCNGCGLTDHGCGMTLLSNELQIRTIGSIPGITGHN